LITIGTSELSGITNVPFGKKEGVGRGKRMPLLIFPSIWITQFQHKLMMRIIQEYNSHGIVDY